MQSDINRVSEALAALRVNTSAALGVLYEVLGQRPLLVGRFLAPVVELAHDDNVNIRLFVLWFLEDAVKFDRHGKNAFVNLKQAVGVWARLLARESHPRVVKRVLEAVSAVLPLALKVVQLDEDPRALYEGLGEIEQTAMALLSQPVSTPVGVQLIRFVEALVLCYSPVPPASAGVRVFDLAEVPDQHPLLRKSNLMEMGESYVVFLVSYLSTAGIKAQMAAAVMSVLSNIACARGGKFLEHIVPALVALDANAPVPGLTSAVDSKSVKKALQLALLRVLKLGEVIVIWAANLEARIVESGGQRQLEKQRRGNKRGREEYDWDFEGPGAGGATDEAMAAQQPLATQATYHAVAAPAAVYVPPDLVLLDAGVLAEVEELIKEMSLEQMADIVIENMAVFAAVGAKPGDEAFFELAVARDPRRSEERRARQKAPKIALAGVTADGLRVPRMSDESGYRRMWRESVVRLLNAEEAMSLKGARGVRLRASLLARLLAGKALDEEVCRAALLHITNDFRARWGVALLWLQEEYRVEGFLEVDDVNVKDEPTLVRDDGGVAKMDEDEQEDGEVVSLKRKQLDLGKRYHYIFMYILDGALGTIDLLQEALSSLLLEAPWLPAGAIEVLRALSNDVEKCEVGQALLSSLAAGRPRYREVALRSLLEEGVCNELRVRTSAIPHLVHLATSNPGCGVLIRDFAQRTFVEASSTHVLNVECKAENFMEHPNVTVVGDDERAREIESQQAELRRLQGEKSAAAARLIQAQEVARTCSLLFALAGFDLSLLVVVAQQYHLLGSVFKQEVHGLMRVCIEHALSNAQKKEPPNLVPVLEQFPPLAKDLLLLALHLVVDSGALDSPSEALTRFCRARFVAEGEDARLLLPVLKVMKGREILQDVPHFLALPRHSLQEFINRALAIPFFVEKPAELLLRFHTTTAAEARCNENELLLRQNAAISLCFLHPRITKDASANLLRKLSEGAAVNSMFMKTAMAAVQKFPDLLPWVQDSLLPKLVKAKVIFIVYFPFFLVMLTMNKAWKDPVLWKGFVKFCLGSIGQGSAAVLLQLPLEILTTLLEEEPSVLPHLKRYVKEHPKSAGTAVKRLLRGNK